MSQLIYDEKIIIEDLKNAYGNTPKSADIRAYCKLKNYNYSTVTKKLDQYKVKRGVWNLEITPEAVEKMEQMYQNSPSQSETNSVSNIESKLENLIPEKDPNFVRFGNYSDLKKIIASRIFYPTFITGLSGNGKTCGVEQVCADLKRELIRVNITIETDEDDLIGGFRLLNGETVWSYGPVITALKRGAILLLDEIDLASNKIMCLQSILEGKGVYLKKTNELIHPAPGFNVIATANTKGQGSEDGKFIGTNVLNEAFLERFALTFEQEYPNTKTEIRILNRLAKDLDILNEDSKLFSENLAKWATLIRKSYNEQAVDEVISTRRLVHIMKAYKIFDNPKKAIQVCLNRFDEDTKKSFIDYYEKVEKTNVKEEIYDNTGNANDFKKKDELETSGTSTNAQHPTGPIGMQGTTRHQGNSNIPMPKIPKVTINSGGSGYVTINSDTTESSVTTASSFVTNWTDELRNSVLDEFNRLQKESKNQY